MMAPLVPCHGCGALVPDTPGPTHRYIGASPGCWAAYGELLARDYGEFGMPPEHRLVVDAYAAQHPGRESLQSVRSVAAHLIALHLVLERGFPPERVTVALRRFSKRPDFIWLEPPADPGPVNVFHVLAARDPEEYARLCRRWAEAVWRSWSPHHDRVRSWAAF